MEIELRRTCFWDWCFIAVRYKNEMLGKYFNGINIDCIRNAILLCQIISKVRFKLRLKPNLINETTGFPSLRFRSD